MEPAWAGEPLISLAYSVCVDTHTHVSCTYSTPPDGDLATSNPIILPDYMVYLMTT